MESRSKVEHEMSLAALRRSDPYIRGIVDVTGQVALYSFSAKANEWEKTDIEGTLFVYTRSASPQHGFTIMNRLNMHNLVEPVNKDLEFQLHEPFLLYRNSSLSIYSIWFYDKNDCQRIAKLMTQVVQQETARATNRKSPVNGCRSQPIDILEMLSKAKNEYEKGQGNDQSSDFSAVKNSPLVKADSLEITEHGSSGPQEKAFQTVQKHLTVEELFGTSLTKDPPVIAYTNFEVCDPFLPDLGEHNTILQPKTIQPVVVKAESRSFNCSASDFSHPNCLPPSLISQGPVDSQNVGTFPASISPSLGSSSEVLGTSVSHGPSIAHLSRMSPLMSQSVSDVVSAPHGQPLIPPLVPIRSSSFSSSTHPSMDLLQKLKLTPQTDSLQSQPISKATIAPKFSSTGSQLATPESFKESSLKSVSSGPLLTSLQNAHEKREPESFAQPLGVSKVVAASQYAAHTSNEAVLWSPSVFQQPPPKYTGQADRTATPPLIHHSTDRARPCPALSRTQLQETLLHLLKNDSSFLNTVHEAYLQVLTKSMENVKL
ncbi:PREDICTED: mRNA-decapping enzyme 1A [Nanorana parkeri]|uniref:mRNA-decapping enzyme 1A n=1 Tax=Nanorana parkeri TaxID=125878 RepID=UPI0008549AAC|nr:PREDICTED: mRNA-decapping enzyme 1A [Nanorana parkeri]